MTSTGNREGDRNLSTADLAAAGRRPPQPSERDEELDSPVTRAGDGRSGAPRAPKDAPLSDRAAVDRKDEPLRERAAVDHKDEPIRSAADRTERAMSSATERKDESSSSAEARRATSMPGRSAPDKPAMDRGAEQLEPLFPAHVAGDYRTRWAAVQSSFVDDPRRAVREGDELVAQMMKDLAESFATERGRLEAQLGQTGESTTETLRVSLRRYRSFFERLLSL